MFFTINNIKIDISLILKVLLNNLNKILAVVVVSLAVAYASCLFVSKLYTADFVIMPPKLSDAGSGLSPAVSATMALAGLSQQRGGSIDTSIAILQTREISKLVREYISRDPRYKSKPVMPYSVDYIPDLRSGFLDISVTSTSPEYSKDVASYIIIALGKHISNIAINKALQRADFYTQQLEIAKNNRDVAESKLLAFKSKYGITSGSQDTIVSAMIVNLQAQYVAQQTALDSMKGYLTPDNPDYKSALAQLNALKKRILDLNTTVDHKKDESMLAESSVSEPSDDVDINQIFASNNTSEFEILQDEYNLRNLIYSVLVKQYEANNLDLQSEQDPVTIDVIDPAVTPTSYSYPRVNRVLIITMIISLCLSITVVLAVNWRKFINNDNV